MPKKFYSLTAQARRKASKYGQNAETLDEAIRNTGDLSEGALLELVLRLNQAIEAMANDPHLSQRSDYDPNSRPSNAKPFPGAKVGDLLYTCTEIEGGVASQVIVSTDNEGYVRTVYSDCEVNEDGRVYCHWGMDSDFTTPKEAMREACTQYIKEYGPDLRRAESVLAALDAGQPYDYLLGESKEQVES